MNDNKTVCHIFSADVVFDRHFFENRQAKIPQRALVKTFFSGLNTQVSYSVEVLCPNLSAS